MNAHMLILKKYGKSIQFCLYNKYVLLESLFFFHLIDLEWCGIGKILHGCMLSIIMFNLVNQAHSVDCIGMKYESNVQILWQSWFSF